MYPWACRFDGAYSVAFKAPGGKLSDWPNVKRWKDDMDKIEGVKESVDVGDAVGSYYRQLFMNNPSGIVFYDDGWGKVKGGEEEGEILGDEVLHFIDD
jgi:glutathionyl-hydroquinone reductase